MKIGLVGAVLLVVLAGGCKSWPSKNFERVTGITLAKGNSICLTISTEDATGDCEPRVGGLDWQKAHRVQPQRIPAAMADIDGAQLIASKYLGHRYSNGSVLTQCPSVNPFTGPDAAKYADYFQLETSRMSLASLLTTSLVKEGRQRLAAAAKSNGHPAISAEGMAAFESALSTRIATTAAQSTDVIYVQGYMPSGLQEVITLAPYAACLDGADFQSESIVTGIAGFYLADFTVATGVVSEELMTAAIEAAAAASAPDSPVLQDVKAEASSAWTVSVTRRLEQQMKGKSFGSTFYPIYIRFERP